MGTWTLSILGCESVFGCVLWTFPGFADAFPCVVESFTPEDATIERRGETMTAIIAQPPSLLRPYASLDFTYSPPPKPTANTSGHPFTCDMQMTRRHFSPQYSPLHYHCIGTLPSFILCNHSPSVWCLFRSVASFYLGVRDFPNFSPLALHLPHDPAPPMLRHNFHETYFYFFLYLLGCVWRNSKIALPWTRMERLA